MTDIQQLPHPDGLDRVETGVVKFGDDWPGVFIRGDNALTFAHMLGEALRYIPMQEYLMKSQVAGLADTLQSCSVGNTGWPPLTPPDTEAHKSQRDMWLRRFDERKRVLMEGGMLAKDADAQAAREIVAELRASE